MLWPDSEKVQPLSAQIGWSHQILTQQQAGGWGDDVVGRIAQDLGADTGSARGFPGATCSACDGSRRCGPIPKRVPSVMAQIGWTAHRVLLDACGDDFLELAENARERHLEQALLDDIQSFLLELGTGFALRCRNDWR
jgi:YhcG PDDEXK nuclease domain